MWIFGTILKNRPLWLCMSFPGKQKYRQVQRGLHQQVSYTATQSKPAGRIYSWLYQYLQQSFCWELGYLRKHRKKNIYIFSSFTDFIASPELFCPWFLLIFELSGVFFFFFFLCFWELWLFRKLLMVLWLLLFLLRFNFSISLKCLGFSPYCLGKDNLNILIFFSL